MVRIRRSFPESVTPKISRSIPSRAAVNQISRPCDAHASPWTVAQPLVKSTFFPETSTAQMVPSSPLDG